MRWGDQRRSDNVEDRRGMGAARGRGMAISGGGLILVLALAFITGENPLTLLEAVTGGPLGGSMPERKPGS
jgi:hypothetical protein